ncbi:MAG: DeoR/GlpR family DNA-binding transcription regulator, partial [Lachnospiraceae bacterium]
YCSMAHQEAMSGAERRIRILEILKQDGKVSVQDLSDRFQVSPMTIRRDLHIYEEQGVLEMQYGGARLRESAPPFEDFARRCRDHHREKSRIAAKAASVIKENDVVFLDCSTTVSLMVDFMPDVHLTIVTNCLPVMAALSSRPNISAITCPGRYQSFYGGVMDYSTISFLDGFNFTKAFLGTSSCSPTFGVSCAEEAEASEKRTVLARTEHGFLLCDAGKMDRAAFLRFAEAKDFDGIFTDAALSQTLQQQYRAAGAALHLC